MCHTSVKFYCFLCFLSYLLLDCLSRCKTLERYLIYLFDDFEVPFIALKVEHGQLDRVKIYLKGVIGAIFCECHREERKLEWRGTGCNIEHFLNIISQILGHLQQGDTLSSCFIRFVCHFEINVGHFEPVACCVIRRK